MLAKPNPIPLFTTRSSQAKTLAPNSERKIKYEKWISGDLKNSQIDLGRQQANLKSNPKLEVYKEQSENFNEGFSNFNNQQQFTNVLKKPGFSTILNSSPKISGFSEVWSQAPLRIIYYISRFLIILKTQTHSYRFKMLNKKIFNILGDKTSDFNFYRFRDMLIQKPNQWQRIIYFCELKIKKLVDKYHFELNIPVIHPDGVFKVLFDILVLILIVVNIFYIPMKLAFQLNKEQQNQIADILFDTMPSIVINILFVYFKIFILEIFLNFNTAFYHEGTIHKNRKQIFRHYLRGDFFGDLIAAVPFFIYLMGVPFMDFFLLLRITRVSKIVEDIEEATSIRERFVTILDLGKLIYILIFVSHVCACVWHYVGLLELEYGYNQTIWIVRYEMEDSPWVSRYIQSFYWSTITTLTVGYGDLVPGNDVERLFVIIMTLITSIVFGYTISSIGSIFTQMKQKNDQFKNNMALMNAFIKKRNLNKSLQIKVRKYFEYHFKCEQDQNDNENFMNYLSQDLQREVNVDMYKQVLMKSKILKNHFSEQLIEELCQHIHIIKYQPGQVIFSSNQSLNKLLFVLEGEVQVYVESKGFTIKNNTQILGDQDILKEQIFLSSFKKNYVIGTKLFFLEKQTEFSTRARKFTEIAFLDHAEFLKCLQKYPKDHLAYHAIKEILLHNPLCNKIGEVCPICRSGHQIFRCPYVFYQVNKPKQLKKLKDFEDLCIQKQSQYARKINSFKHRCNFFAFRNEIQEESIQFCIENGMMHDQYLNSEQEKQYGLFTDNLSYQEESVNQIIEEDNKSNKQLFQRKKNNFRNQIIMKKAQDEQFRSTDKTIISLQKANKKLSLIQNEYTIEERQKSHLDHIWLDFTKIIKEDTLPELDRAVSLVNYFDQFNLEDVIKKYNEKVDPKLRLKFKWKSTFKKNRFQTSDNGSKRQIGQFQSGIQSQQPSIVELNY